VDELFKPTRQSVWAFVNIRYPTTVDGRVLMFKPVRVRYHYLITYTCMKELDNFKCVKITLVLE